MLAVVDSMQSDKDASKWSAMSFTYVFDHVFHGAIFVLLLYIVYIPIAYYRHLLSWHAILGTIAFLLLMSESITIFSDNSWYIKIARNRKIIIHGIIFALATGFAILSTCFEYYRKATRKGHGHFDSFHGVFALLATIGAVLACISGLAVANHDWCQKYVAQIRPVVLKLSHNVMGLISYILGMLSLCCAYYSNWFISRTYLGERIVLVILTLCLTLYTLQNALKNMRSQIISLQE